MFFEDVEHWHPEPHTPRPILMVTRPRRDLSIDHFLEVVTRVKPRFVVPPYEEKDPAFTSAAAERVRAQLPKNSGIATGVVCITPNNSERIEFLYWAAQQNYRPIVLLPDQRYPRDWQLNHFNSHQALVHYSWYHLSGDYDYTFDPTKYPGTWSWGIDIRQDRSFNGEPETWKSTNKIPSSSND